MQEVSYGETTKSPLILGIASVHGYFPKVSPLNPMFIGEKVNVPVIISNDVA